MRGLSYGEVADMLSISEKTVESHIARALKRLRTVATEVDLFSIFV
ncbi:sigma factor-like helix-turn-helix DNA-binding protein [Aquimarina intermedia]|nr:sigma factor-like helix-turn-helix DNA-binding protein [Aquimarina intermedia]